MNWLRRGKATTLVFMLSQETVNVVTRSYPSGDETTSTCTRAEAEAVFHANKSKMGERSESDYIFVIGDLYEWTRYEINTKRV